MTSSVSFTRGLFLGLIFLLYQSTAFSQFLEKKISLKPAAEDLNLKQVLDTLSAENDFYFSYESSLLDLKQELKTPNYSGTIRNFLETEIGDQYEFKELPGYIIIRFAPEKLDLDAEMQTRFRRVTIKGQITNIRTQEGVNQASIYDKNTLASTLTDENGYFELKYKKDNSSIWLTLSKENYRDTTFLLLPTVDIVADQENKRFRYLPGDSTTQSIEESFMGRLFIGFRQRLQGINVGSFFAESPFQMSLVPGISSKGIFNSQTISNFSLNLIGGYTAGIEGMEIAGIFNINKRDVKSFQAAGIFNMVGGGSKGFQVGGIYNLVYKNVEGLQVGGIYNQVQGNVKGLQIGGINNRVKGSADAQIGGILNQASASDVLQIAGIANHSREKAGFQLAGISNSSSGEVNHQISGIFNRAKSVNGFQFALINAAEQSDYPIGLLNFIKNGEKNLTFAIDESGFTHFGFRSGGRKMYGIVGLAYQLREVDTPYALEVGMGIHLIPSRRFSLDTEFVAMTASDFVAVNNHIQSFRLLPGVNLGKHFRLFAGPSLNFAFLDPGQENFTDGWNILEKTNSTGIYRSYGGVTGGLQVVF
ncbi:carboxypeptidase-like regulatory domain-containing protein [Algoriphagus halophytocola]|uniref:Carboxypeptidase-like regulatory domain-containing protein n=1 Tax=Algoriphagus halophytocola TaxID=2991499 RepID=A0ABY6MIF6_9BACT|nr:MULTISPECIES: carboxypeptidase-like regulatory domain-containing protein [unclassified Algoriphagus]UZD23577.1 carboxypeptidase-like regulatory domain-containing protein [Algoriphagus sp. TR-M5]WBL44871.1 carboxypeptidase-like regulatory domain-containing protein [Algoriphagus sp. TR-M9]